MKLTNFAIINRISLLNNFATKKLPQKISYAITRNLVLLQNDYLCYTKSLNKLFSDYDKFIRRDENENVILSEYGIPIVDDKVAKEFNEELTNLLNIEIEMELYYISENEFNYDDCLGKYDSLSPMDIINLQSILCHNDGQD